MEEHRIRAYEVGPDQRTTIVTIANLLQVSPWPSPRMVMMRSAPIRGSADRQRDPLGPHLGLSRPPIVSASFGIESV